MQDSSYVLTIYLLVHHIYKSALIIVGFPTFLSFHKYLVDNDNSTIIYLKSMPSVLAVQSKLSLSNLVPGRHTRYTLYLEGQIHCTRHFNFTYSLSLSSWTGCKDIIELNENLYQQNIHPLEYTYTHLCKNLSESSFELFIYWTAPRI